MKTNDLGFRKPRRSQIMTGALDPIPFVKSIFHPSDFLLAVLATDGIDDYQGGIAPCRLARTTADAKTLKL